MARQRGMNPCWCGCGKSTPGEFFDTDCMVRWQASLAERPTPFDGPPPVFEPRPTNQHIKPNGDGTYTVKLDIHVEAKSVNVLSLQRILDAMDAEGNIGIKVLYEATYKPTN